MQQQQQQSDEEDCSVFTFGGSSNTGCTSVEDTSSSKGEEDVDEFLQFLYGGDGDDMSGWEDDMPWEDIDLVHYAEQAAVDKTIVQESKEDQTEHHKYIARQAKKRKGVACSSSSSSATIAAASPKPKRSRLSSLEAGEVVYKFPAKLVGAMNVGNDEALDKLIREYCVPSVTLNYMDLFSVTGHEKVYNYFLQLSDCCPDMHLGISDLRLRRNRSIVFKGMFEGTYTHTAVPSTYLDQGEMGETEIKQMEVDLDCDCAECKAFLEDNGVLLSSHVQAKTTLRKELGEDDNPSHATVCKSTYIIRVIFGTGAGAGAGAGGDSKKSTSTTATAAGTGTGQEGGRGNGSGGAEAPEHQLITRIDWVWKSMTMSRHSNEELGGGRLG